MSLLDTFRALLPKTARKQPLIADNPHFNPRMVQRPLIDAGNTGRYSLDAFMVAFNAPARGTLAPNAPASAGVYLDVTAQHAATYGGMGTIPQTMGTQGLIKGFRDNAL